MGIATDISNVNGSQFKVTKTGGSQVRYNKSTVTKVFFGAGSVLKIEFSSDIQEPTLSIPLADLRVAGSNIAPSSEANAYSQMDTAEVFLEANSSSSGTGGINSLDDVPDSSNRLALLPTERTKLNGVAANATANVGDVTLNGVQTILNKTLTAPVINNPTGITADNLTETASRAFVSPTQKTNLDANTTALGARSTTSEIINSSHIAFWGDSLTWGEGGWDGSYPSKVAALSGMQIYNGGISGQTTAQIQARLTAASDMLGWSTVIWAGRNDISNSIATNTIEANIDAMVTALGHNRYIVIGITNTSTEPTGNANLTKINTINSYLATKYGTRFIDIRAYLLTQGTGTGQDATDVASGIIPTSLRNDATHLNNAGYTLVASQIFSKISLLQSASVNIVSASNAPAFTAYPKYQFSIGQAGKYQIGGQQVLFQPDQTVGDGSLYVGNGGSSGGVAATGPNNTTVGNRAGYVITTGAQNTLMGRFAGLNVVTGSQNTVVGFSAGGAGDFNWCTFLGNGAGNNVTTAYKCISIGHGSQVPNATSNYQMSIANAIYGTTMDGDNQTISTGNIGLFVKAPNSKLQVAGSVSLSTISKTAAYTAGINDYTIRCNSTTSAFTVTLPTAVGIDGRIYVIKKTDASANAITVATTSSQTIDGATSYSLPTQYKYVTLQSNGATWDIIGNN